MAASPGWAVLKARPLKAEQWAADARGTRASADWRPDKPMRLAIATQGLGLPRGRSFPEATPGTNESEKSGRWAELRVEGWCLRGVPRREWQVDGPMAQGPRGGGAARDGGGGGGPGAAMDRVSSTMKQVSNPLPKVLSWRAGGGGLEAERESFERAQVRAERGGAGDANDEEGKVPAEGARPGWGAVRWERPARCLERI